MLRKEKVTVREISQLMGRLPSIAVLPAPLHYRSLKNQQTSQLSISSFYNREVTLPKEAISKIQWGFRI